MPRKPPAQCSPHTDINDCGGDDDRARRLPVYVRFRDIKAAGIAKNWPTLTRLIEEEGFPRGVMLSPNIRAWKLAEVEQWLASRPVERKPVPTRWGGDRRIATTT
jgi:predicted DNA-binding transcriptional regulator AlpA